MQDLEGKKTVLDDTAEIYKSGSARAESHSSKEHWKSLDRKGKWQYFRNYYLLKTVLAVLACALIGYMIYLAVRPKPKELAFVVILDSAMDAVTIDEYFEQSVESLGYSKKKAIINSDKRLTSSKQNVTDMQTISTYIFAKTLDIMIAPSGALDHYAQQRILRDLAETLPADLLAEIPEENRYIYHYVPEKDDPEGSVERDIFVGIRINHSAMVEDAKFTTGEVDYVLSLVATGSEDRLKDIYGIVRFLIQEKEEEEEDSTEKENLTDKENSTDK